MKLCLHAMIALWCTLLLCTASATAAATMTLDPKASWTETKALYLAQILNDSSWKKRWWIEKSVRIARGGRGWDVNENPDDWVNLSEQEIVDRLLADPRIGDMALDFNMYFTGNRIDEVRINGDYSPTIFEYPAALASAHEVVTHGDYFKLLDLTAPIYLGRPQVSRDQDDANKTDLEVISRYLDGVQTQLQTIITASNAAGAQASDICSMALAALPGMQQSIQRAGVQQSFYLNELVQDPKWMRAINVACPANNSAKLADVQTALNENYKKNATLFALMKKMADANYHPKSLLELEAVDPQTLELSLPYSSYGFSTRVALQNSSTNMDRKRSAYVLRHYFCDDLTPIGLAENPGAHTGNPHGADTSCFACHYKLDPMAGFFRYEGRNFTSFENRKTITFDDKATADMNQYADNWRAPAGSGRTWEVGYVRSTSQPELNDYGSTLEDLHALLRRAPEVRSCIVKRLFEYVVAEDQTIDGGYLGYLTQEMNTRAKTNSADAFKWVVGQLLLSQSFTQSDLDPNTCYDFKPGYDPAHAPPCRVAYILNQNCVHCHGAIDPRGRLDLSSWKQLADGSYDFPHLNGKGQQYSTKDTMTEIVDRLSESDPDRRMPAGGLYMSAQDREELYHWAEAYK